MFAVVLLLSFIISTSSNYVDPSKPQPKIIGGEPAKLNEIPYQVSIQFFTGGHVCGGSVVTLRHVLSAAHCAFVQPPLPIDVTYIRVVGGTHDLATCGEEPCAQVRDVSHMILHDQYAKPGIFNYDVGLLMLTKPFVESDSLRPIALRTTPTATGESCLVSGWGYTTPGGPDLPSVLQKVTVPIMPHVYCFELYKPIFTDNMICAGYNDGGKDSCNGDSGGPLVCNGTLTGIVSFGPEVCATPYLPGVYTEVAKIEQWIKDNIEEFKCKAKSRVIGGQEIDVNAAPYQVYIFTKNNGTGVTRYKCSGTLLTLGHVLTTSTCVNNLNGQGLVVIAGAITADDTTRQTGTIEKIERSADGAYDVAVLFLEANFTASAKVSPKQLKKVDVADCEECSVAGLGNWLPGSPFEYKLLRSLVTKLDGDDCEAMVGGKLEDAICTYNRGPGPCVGDEGGPLICKGEVAGIVASTNVNCTDANKPSIYIDLENRIDWINKVINGAPSKGPAFVVVVLMALFAMNKC